MSTTEGEMIEFRCRHCGATLRFPAVRAGRVEVCIECAKYVDVPSSYALRGLVESASVTLSSGHEFRFEAVEGLPRPQWDTLIPALYVGVPESDLDAVLTEAARYWLAHLGSACGPGYHATESHNFHLLSRLDERQAQGVVEFCEQTLSRIIGYLSGIAADEGHGPHVVLAFDSTDPYYRYIAYFYPEGVFGGSGGVFISDGGYQHIAMPYLPNEWHRTLTHELVHTTLSHLPLPPWLNEGLTMLVEWQLTGVEPVTVNADVRSRLREYWRKRRLESFWSGESFSFDDEGQELSYALAFIIALNLSLDAKEGFREFACRAHFQDAGQQACEDVIGQNLADLTSRTLGDGDWSPQGGYSDETRGLLEPLRLVGVAS
jgi:hypothetical protein